jgi:hypothetical protein
MSGFANKITALGKKNGYQHLWLTGKATPAEGLAKITWLNDNGRFYTQTAIVDGKTEALFTRIGANDPNFNLRNESGFIYRKKAAKSHRFVSVLEPHGEYNPSKEFTLSAKSTVSDLRFSLDNNVNVIKVELSSGHRYLLAINTGDLVEKNSETNFSYQQVNYTFNGRFNLFKLNVQQ